MLVQEGEGTVDGEVNQLGVQQDLGQSPEEPKASAEVEEGKHQSALTFFWLNSHFYFSLLCYAMCI
jgi:hypothetical protein